MSKANKTPEKFSFDNILHEDLLGDAKDIGEATARVAHLAQLALFALVGAAEENRKHGYEGVVYENIDGMLAPLLETLWIAAVNAHRLVASDKAGAA